MRRRPRSWGHAMATSAGGSAFVLGLGLLVVLVGAALVVRGLETWSPAIAQIVEGIFGVLVGATLVRASGRA